MFVDMYIYVLVLRSEGSPPEWSTFPSNIIMCKDNVGYIHDYGAVEFQQNWMTQNLVVRWVKSLSNLTEKLFHVNVRIIYCYIRW